MEYLQFMRQPNINMVAGIKVTKNTDIEYETGDTKQSIKDLVYHSVTHTVNDNVEVTQEVTVKLNEGDIVLYPSDEQGYVVPANKYMTVTDAIQQLKCVEVNHASNK